MKIDARTKQENLHLPRSELVVFLHLELDLTVPLLGLEVLFGDTQPHFPKPYGALNS